MRILQISHYYPPETHGGTQGYVRALGRRLCGQGHEIRVIAGASTSHAPLRTEETMEDGIPVTRLHRDHAMDQLSGDLGSEIIRDSLEPMIMDFSPTVVHVHHWHALTRDLVSTVKRLGFPVVLTLHDLFTTCPRHFRMPDARSFCNQDVTFEDCARCVAPDMPHLDPSDLEGVLSERFQVFQEELARADVALAVSDAQKTLLESIPGFDFEHLEVLPLGIDEPGAAHPDLPPFDGDRLLVSNWAGLDPRKGAHILVQAVAQSEHRDRIELHFHGRDGEPGYMDELRRCGEGINLQFHGEYSDAERADFANRYHLAVFPFLAFETHALVVDEALAMGIPVVVPDHGAPADRVGSRGVVVPSGDPDALERVLVDVLDSPGRLEALRAGDHRALQLDDHVDALMEIYRRIT